MAASIDHVAAPREETGTQNQPDVMKYLRAVGHTFAIMKNAVYEQSDVERSPARDIDLHEAQRLLRQSLYDVLYVLKSIPSRPIMRLPPETLCRVFEHLQQDCLFIQSPPENVALPSHPFAWTVVLKVCQNWRTVAESCPSLWTNLLADDRGPIKALWQTDRGPRYWEYFAKRSGDLPLSISVDAATSSGPAPSASSIMDAYLHRTRELHIGGRWSHDQLDSFSKPAPLLSTLFLSHVSIVGELSDREGKLFGGDLSSLRSLALDDVQTTHSHLRLKGNYQHLRQLYLSSLGRDLLTGIIGTLAGTPHLEDLMFSKTRIYPLKPQQQEALLILPRLKRLVLHSVEDVGNLLDFLCLPEHVFVSVKRSTYKPERILPDDPMRFAGFQSFKRIKICLPFDGTSTGHLFAISDSSALQADVQLYPKTALGQRTRYIMCGIEEIWIERIHDSSPYVVWESEDLLASVCLRRVVVDLYTSGCNALSAFIPDAGGPCNCPLLELLEIRILELSKGVIEQLWEILAVRKARGCPIKTLRLGRFGEVEAADTDAESHYSRRKKVASKKLKPLVDTLEFVDEEPLPRMKAVPICNAPSAGAWQWPLWEDM